MSWRACASIASNIERRRQKWKPVFAFPDFAVGRSDKQPPNRPSCGPAAQGSTPFFLALAAVWLTKSTVPVLEETWEHRLNGLRWT
jgi:hypothetical protein